MVTVAHVLMNAYDDMPLDTAMPMANRRRRETPDIFEQILSEAEQILGPAEPPTEPPTEATTGKGKGKGKGFEPFSGKGRRLDDLNSLD